MVRSKITGFFYLLALIVILISFFGVVPLAVEYWFVLIIGGSLLLVSMYLAFSEGETRFHPCRDWGRRMGASAFGLISCCSLLGIIFLTSYLRGEAIDYFPHLAGAHLSIPDMMSINIWLLAAVLSFLGALVYEKSNGDVIDPPHRERPHEEPERHREPSQKPQPWVPSKRKVTVAVCTRCRKWNNPAREDCWNCGHSLAGAPHHTESFDASHNCVVCSGEIRARDRIVLCPECRVQGHWAHLLEYVRVQAACPNCGRSLRLAELLPTT